MECRGLGDTLFSCQFLAAQSRLTTARLSYRVWFYALRREKRRAPRTC